MSAKGSTQDPGRPSALRRLGVVGGGTILALLAVVLVTAAADRAGLAADLSADRRFSIDPALATLAAAQTENVSITAFWGNDAADVLDDIETALQRIAGLSSHLRYRRIDPELQQPLKAAFESEHGCAVDAPALYLTRGKQAFQINVHALLRRRLQREIGGALVALADPQPPLAAVLQGHGELRPGGGGEDGCDLALRDLELAGFRVALLDAARPGSFPAEALLVVPGPTAPLGSRDIADLDRHLHDGGSALVLADDRAPADLTAWLRRRGVLGGAGVPQDVIDRRGVEWVADAQAKLVPNGVLRSTAYHIGGHEDHLLLAGDTCLNDRHDITRALAAGGRSLLLPRTAQVVALDLVRHEAVFPGLAKRYAAAGIPPFATARLLATRPGDAWIQAWNEVLKPQQGQSEGDAFACAVAVVFQQAQDSAQAARPDGGRLLVLGSRQAASNQVLYQRSFANSQFLSESATWLMRRAGATAIPEAETAAFQVRGTNRHLTIVGILLVLVPCALLGVAMLAWWDRR